MTSPGDKNVTFHKFVLPKQQRRYFSETDVDR